MPTLYDGNRVYPACPGAPVLSAHHNAFQDQIILGVEERTTAVSIFEGKHDTVAANNWSLVTPFTNDPPSWYNTLTNSNHIVSIPIEPKVGEYITEIGVVIGGSDDLSGGNDGSIKVYYRATNSTAVAVYGFDIGGATPWAGPGQTIHTAVTGYSQAAARSYFVRFEAPNSGFAAIYIYGVYYKSQFLA